MESELWKAIGYYSSLLGTAMGIGLGLAPIVPFSKIVRGIEKVRIFPESMIFFNILCPDLWACYWIRQDLFVPFFSAAAGLILGLVFATIYMYFYLDQNTIKWIGSLLIIGSLFSGFHYCLLYIVPKYSYIGFAAMITGILTNIAPAQNVLKVIRDGEYKLIPITSTVFGGLVNVFWLLFGISLIDWNNIIVNGICLVINIVNTSTYIYYYLKRNKKEENEGNEKLKSEDNEA